MRCNGKQAEPHLEHRDAQQPEADKRQRGRQSRAESGDRLLEPVERSRDDDRIFRIRRIVTG